MNRGLAIAMSIIAIAIIGCGGLFLYWMATQNQSQYDIIASRWTSNGRFVDYSNDTGVKDASDIVYYVDKEEKSVEILYGYITLHYSFKEMLSKEWQEKLAYIGITYDIKPTTNDDFHLYWCGEELGRCASKPSVG